MFAHYDKRTDWYNGHGLTAKLYWFPALLFQRLYWSFWQRTFFPHLSTWLIPSFPLSRSLLK